MRAWAVWRELPVSTKARLLVLLGMLFGAKLFLLDSLKGYLFEMHWRIGNPDFAWYDYLGAYGLIVVGCLGILLLHRRCERTGLPSLRALNALILVLGFIVVSNQPVTWGSAIVPPLTRRPVQCLLAQPPLPIKLDFGL